MEGVRSGEQDKISMYEIVFCTSGSLKSGVCVSVERMKRKQGIRVLLYAITVWVGLLQECYLKRVF